MEGAKNVEAHRDGLSACLILKDDNFKLEEWLAYHWLKISLQHLVVSVDPKSMESPRGIFETWREIAGMDIILWFDPHFCHEK